MSQGELSEETLAHSSQEEIPLVRIPLDHHTNRRFHFPGVPDLRRSSLLGGRTTTLKAIKAKQETNNGTAEFAVKLVSVVQGQEINIIMQAESINEEEMNVLFSNEGIEGKNGKVRSYEAISILAGRNVRGDK
ncbi:hypothetical protein T265_10569 [Opisthorchis viverrini]|uniref:Uncharacterized protein n=1 Tax=Opisthorchis viverrini TaxID=6198 RepID=A0A074Z636_OPIVI|nr:hypothetical protein T265_10569 [Opisthorchis viverrini]KER21017.1 hypothetical protein T265_10569 [Opisthorchis viverrini]